MPLIEASLIMGGSAILSALSSGVGQRVATKFMPTAVEGAQATYYRQTLENSRRQLEAQEERFVRELEHRRLLQQEHLLAGLESSRLQQHHQHGLNRWPFQVLPGALLSFSKEHSGRRLNVVVAVKSPTGLLSKPKLGKGSDAPSDSDKFVDSIRLIQRSIACADADIIPLFGDTIRFYDETRIPIPGSATGIATNVWDFLKTEPMAFFVIDPVNPNVFQIDVSVWGMGYAADSPVSANIKATLDLRRYENQAEARKLAVMFGISSLIVGVADAFRATHYPHLLTAPVFPSLIEDSQKAGLPTAAWGNVVSSYSSALDSVAGHSPLIASELAAQTAVRLNGLGLNSTAATFLDLSFRWFAMTDKTDLPPTLLEAHLALGRSLPKGVASGPDGSFPSLAERLEAILRRRKY